MMPRLKIAPAVAAIAVGLAATDRLTGGALSSAVAQFTCGADYMAPLDGSVTDLSCGFNADMHFMLAMAALAATAAAVALKRRR